MIKIKIVFDENKIKKDEEYEVEDIKNHVKKYFDIYDFKEVEKNIYSDNGKKGDVESLIAIVGTLKECSWFMTYIEEFIWIDEEDDYIENLLD